MIITQLASILNLATTTFMFAMINIIIFSTINIMIVEIATIVIIRLLRTIIIIMLRMLMVRMRMIIARMITTPRVDIMMTMATTVITILVQTHC